MITNTGNNILHGYCDESKENGRYILGLLLCIDKLDDAKLLHTLNSFGKKDKLFCYHANNDFERRSRSQSTAKEFIDFIQQKMIFGEYKNCFIFYRFIHRNEKEAYIALRDKLCLLKNNTSDEFNIFRDRGDLSKETVKIIKEFETKGIILKQIEKNKSTIESRLISVVDYILYKELNWPRAK